MNQIVFVHRYSMIKFYQSKAERIQLNANVLKTKKIYFFIRLKNRRLLLITCQKNKQILPRSIICWINYRGFKNFQCNLLLKSKLFSQMSKTSCKITTCLRKYNFFILTIYSCVWIFFCAYNTLSFLLIECINILMSLPQLISCINRALI